MPADSAGARVSISEDGRSALAREMQHLAEAGDTQMLVDLRGRDGQLRLGLMALGQSSINEWSSKGMVLSEASILAAGEAFQSAFRENLAANGSSAAGSSIALNRHQIVMDSQTVPDWFVKEYERTLSAMGDSEVKRAFERGEMYVVSAPTA